MTEPTDRQPPPADDELLARYREAIALEALDGPDVHLRAAVLAQAQVQAWKRAALADDDAPLPTTPQATLTPNSTVTADVAATTPPLTPPAPRVAANDRHWLVAAVASVAVLGLAGLLALQFDRSGSDAEKDLALGRPAAPAASIDPAPTQTPATAPTLPPNSVAAASAPAAAPAQPQVRAASTPSLDPTTHPAPNHAEAAAAAAAPAAVQEVAPAHPAPAAAPAVSDLAPPAEALGKSRERVPTSAGHVAPSSLAEKDSPFAAAKPSMASSANITTGAANRQAEMKATQSELESRNASAAPTSTWSAASSASARTTRARASVRSDKISSADRARSAETATESTAPSAAAMAPSPAQARAPATDEAAPLERTAPALSPQQRLLAAAALGQPDVVQQMLAQGAAVDATDDSGRTALMLAARRGNVTIVRLLQAAGADVRRTDRLGLSAIDYARRAGHEALARHLETSPSRQAP